MCLDQVQEELASLGCVWVGIVGYVCSLYVCVCGLFSKAVSVYVQDPGALCVSNISLINSKSYTFYSLNKPIHTVTLTVSKVIM